MNHEEFNRLAAAGYNRIPVSLELFADLDTPMSVYLKLANQPYSYLLESVVGGERFGRYSFIGLPSNTRLRVNGQQVQVEYGDKVIERHSGDPLAFIEAFQQRFHTRRNRTCRASPAAWSATSATTPYATSKSGWPKPPSPTPSAPRTCC